MTNYTIYRTEAPVIVRALRSDLALEAGFVVLILTGAFSAWRLIDIILNLIGLPA